MRFELIIDGYNLLHIAGLARPRYRPGEFERARTRLLQRLARGLTPQEQQGTTVVFDAQHAESADRSPQSFSGMKVMFSPRGLQADDTIEELLRTHADPRRVIVISSDHRLHRAARAAAAGIVDADSFLIELENRHEHARRAGEQVVESLEQPTATADVPLSEEELNGWLAEFQDLDVNGIARDLAQEHRGSPQDAKVGEHAAGEIPVLRAAKTSPDAARSAPDLAFPDAPELPELGLDFWEQRIADLLREEQSPGNHDSRQSPHTDSQL